MTHYATKEQLCKTMIASYRLRKPIMRAAKDMNWILFKDWRGVRCCACFIGATCMAVWYLHDK
jgi:hypothetical protein